MVQAETHHCQCATYLLGSRLLPSPRSHVPRAGPPAPTQVPAATIMTVAVAEAESGRLQKSIADASMSCADCWHCRGERSSGCSCSDQLECHAFAVCGNKQWHLPAPDGCGGIKAGCCQVLSIWRPAAGPNGAVVSLLQECRAAPGPLAPLLLPDANCHVPAAGCQCVPCISGQRNRAEGLHRASHHHLSGKNSLTESPSGDHSTFQTRSVCPSSFCRCSRVPMLCSDHLCKVFRSPRSGHTRTLFHYIRPLLNSTSLADHGW